MSETVHYRGILRKLERLKGESLEEQCKRLMNNKDLPSYYDTYQDYLAEDRYQDMTIQNGNVYRVEKEEINPYEDIFTSDIQENGDIKFEVRYYNGGCGFDEAIMKAIELTNHKLRNKYTR